VTALERVRVTEPTGHRDNLYVFTPTRGAPKPAWVDCMRALERAWAAKASGPADPQRTPQVWPRSPEGGEYADCWNLSLAEFLATGWGKAMVIDDDETFDVGIVERLVAFANTPEGAGAVVWVPYHTKNPGTDGVPFVHGLAGKWLDVMAQREPVRTAWAPGGFCLFTRAALLAFIAAGRGREYVDASGRWLYDFATSDFVLRGPGGGEPAAGVTAPDADHFWVKRGPDLRFFHEAHAAGVPIWMLPEFGVGHYGTVLHKLPQAPAAPLSDRSVVDTGRHGGAWGTFTAEEKEAARLAHVYSEEFYRTFADQAPEYAAVADSLVAWCGAGGKPTAGLSVFDVGCGPGQLIGALRARGIDASGVDGSPHARAAALPEVRPCVETGDLFSLGQRGPFDVVTCFEVAEHVEERRAAELVAVLDRLAHRGGLHAWRGGILVTAALPGQGGTDHVNEQPPEYWRALFAKVGRTLDADATMYFREAWRSFVRMPWMTRTVQVFR
jgi:SAM-dependent methyltransferase